jgi:hypothetical protein
VPPDPFSSAADEATPRESPECLLDAFLAVYAWCSQPNVHPPGKMFFPTSGVSIRSRLAYNGIEECLRLQPN